MDLLTFRGADGTPPAFIAGVLHGRVQALERWDAAQGAWLSRTSRKSP